MTANSIKFQDKSAIVIAGASQSGKSNLMRDILLHARDLFQTEPTVCYLVFSHWQKIYDEIRQKWKERIIFNDKVPEEQELQNTMREHEHGIFIADDKGEEIEKNSFFRNLLCRLGHHCRMSSICLVQDATFSSKTSSILRKNFHVSIVMRSPQERGFVRSLAMQTGDYHCLMEAYDDAVRRPYGYIVIDYHPAGDPEFKYRTNIIPHENNLCIVYRAKEK